MRWAHDGFVCLPETGIRKEKRVMEKQKPTRWVPVLLAFALLVIDGSASSVSAQTDTTLVSNLGEAVSTLIVAVHSGQKVGVNFRTGPADAAWILSGIKLETPTWPDGTTPMVHLHQVKNGAPGSTLATLTNPTRGTGTRTYPAPSGVLLKPKKTYSFVVESPDTDHPQYIGFGIKCSTRIHGISCPSSTTSYFKAINRKI